MILKHQIGNAIYYTAFTPKGRNVGDRLDSVFPHTIKDLSKWEARIRNRLQNSGAICGDMRQATEQEITDYFS